jgi:hypothetical protein
MPKLFTDAILWYNVGKFGSAGYAVPNWSDDIKSLNASIKDLTDVVGRNLSNIMHHEDADLRTPPSINTLKRIHRLYIRAGQILAARAIPPGQDNMETMHVSPSEETFCVFPVPYFRVRNSFMKGWCRLCLTMLSEAFQHTENRKEVEISTAFAGLMGQYLTRIYTSMATELFGKTAAEVRVPGFLLQDADFAAYDPAQFFTSTEMSDTVPAFDQVFTEDMRKSITEGIPVTQLPSLDTWPGNAAPSETASSSSPSPSVSVAPIFPAAPSP